jgi:uncharacterized membrane protein
MLLGWTRLGFIPVPTAAGNATIMHVPAIIGGVMEGWIVGAIVGTLFGIFSFINAVVPMFKDPLVAILPRIFIGITAAGAFFALRRFHILVALVAAATVGTLTNTLGVLGMAVIRGYMPLNVAIVVAVTHGIPEIVVASIITLAVVVAWRRVETGRQKAKM